MAADEIVGGEGEDEVAAYALQAAQDGLGDGAYGLAPAEGLFYPFADTLAYGILASAVSEIWVGRGIL